MKSLIIDTKYSNAIESYRIILPVISFREDNSVIIYCPALNLSGYGNTEQEARDSFRIVIDEYLNYTTHKKTLVADLKNLGWTIHKKSKGKLASPPPMTELLENNDEFTRIFDNFPYKKFNAELSLPVYA